MKRTLLLILLLVISVSYALPIEPIIYVNKSTVDYQNAKILMDNFYSSREININGDNVTIVINDIMYIPSIDELEIKNGDKNLIIKFDRDGNKVKYKDIECIEYLNLKKGEEISLFNKSYIVEDITSNYVILKEKDGKEVLTNESFEYDGYKVVVKLVSSDLNTIIVDIYKNEKVLDSPKLTKGKIYYMKGGTLGLMYENCTRIGKGYRFTFRVYSTIKIEEGEDYPLDKEFKVKEISTDKIKLEYKNIDSLGNEIYLFNYTIIPEKCYKDYVLFKVIKRKEKTVDVKDVAYIGDGIYAVKVNNTVHVFYKGKELKNHEKIYLGSVDVYSSNPLNVNKDIILIGGPKVNKIVKELEDKGLLKVNISTNYPGNNRGIILKIKNPYNDNNIYILAGSDRWGTKAAILVFLTKYNDEDTLMVEWDKGEIKIIK
ncbi:S-layer protein [Methanocaldococcus jannaschii]|uniref:S-layer protein n=1 Tax=Methanocaldococcus jannaschii TaxID=2190 RepID=UPI000A3FB6E8|nr:S-layer protein [Methanocaldococcus jannaschii]